ncbi:hypothetical protein Adt_21042 [Abeliophyllum distichum]|uniref:Uncharacterized protein n=1 Tax=Abeliophyllum distichum TaxID=126358 RepID=A0ABD1SYG7_9LAMI
MGNGWRKQKGLMPSRDLLPYRLRAMDEDDDEDAPPPSHPRPSSNRPSSSTSGFTFTQVHYNLFNGQIDRLTTMVDGLQTTVASLQHSINGLTSLLQQVLASQQETHSHIDIVFPLPPPPEN